VTPSGEAVIFFDLRALGVEVAAANGERMIDFIPDARALDTVAELGGQRRLGVLAIDAGLSAEGAEATVFEGDLARLIDPTLRIITYPEDGDPFQRALAAAGLTDTPDRALYVGLDATHRTEALRVGMRVVAHPALARPVLEGRDLALVHAEVESLPADGWGALFEGLPAVPIYLTRDAAPALYALAPPTAFDHLLLAGARPRVLAGPDVLARGRFYLLQVDPRAVVSDPELRAFVARLRDELPMVELTPSGFLVSIPGGRGIGDFHPPKAGHGHTLLLDPNLASLLAPAPAGPVTLRALSPEEQIELAKLDAAVYKSHLDPVRGKVPMPTTGGTQRIVSRHVAHPHNEHATWGLAERLASILGTPAFVLPFGTYGSRVLGNIWADIPGTTSEFVIVGAHFDSTASFTSGYTGNESFWAAPGADDDGSGVAGVLAAAQVLKALSEKTQPYRTLRFVLFNDEEQGMGGSSPYTAALKSQSAVVAAMFQMDMIGWVEGSCPTGVFEVHGTGTGDFPKVYVASTALAQLVASAAAQVSTDLVPQVYPLPGCSKDPATNRSDHAWFHFHDWPACMVSEDLFADVCTTPVPQSGNPHYHKVSDVDVNESFASDVARAVAGAAWIAANPTLPPIVEPPPGWSGRGGRSDESPVEPPKESDSAGTIETPGSSAMPSKFLVEFLALWIRDEAFRCAVMHQENTALDNYGMTAKQKLVLLSLDKERIIPELVRELEEDLGIDLSRVREAVGGSGPVPTPDPMPVPIPVPPPDGSGGAGLRTGARLPEPLAAPAASTLEAVLSGASASATGATALSMLLASATVYYQGQCHVRGIEPTTGSVNVERIFQLRGQGFDASPEVEFAHDVSGSTKSATVLGVSCDIDVFQRTTVKVTLDQSGEWVVSARNPSEPWSTEDTRVLVL
jgi:hypothetical protein